LTLSQPSSFSKKMRMESNVLFRQAGEVNTFTTSSVIVSGRPLFTSTNTQSVSPLTKIFPSDFLANSYLRNERTRRMFSTHVRISISSLRMQGANIRSYVRAQPRSHLALALGLRQWTCNVQLQYPASIEHRQRCSHGRFRQ
jgi:hypothetical protein